MKWLGHYWHYQTGTLSFDEVTITHIPVNIVRNIWVIITSKHCFDVKKIRIYYVLATAWLQKFIKCLVAKFNSANGYQSDRVLIKTNHNNGHQMIPHPEHYWLLLLSSKRWWSIENICKRSRGGSIHWKTNIFISDFRSFVTETKSPYKSKCWFPYSPTPKRGDVM